MSDFGTRAEFQPDRRRAERHRTRRKALVVTNSVSTQNAEILNLSTDGAMVQFEGIGAFPETFELRFDDRKKCVVRIWTRGLRAGVAFKD